MFERYGLIGLVFAFIFVVLDFYLLKERKIRGKGFVFWLIIGAILGLFSLLPGLITMLSFAIGTELTTSAVIVVVFIFFLFTTFYFHYRINELQSMLTKLAVEISVRKYVEGGDQSDLNTKPRKSSSHGD